MLKNSDKDKQLDSLNNKKTALLEEKLSLKKQLEKKDAEISDLNTKLNERLMELRDLKADKQLLDERLVNNDCFEELQQKSMYSFRKNSEIQVICWRREILILVD